MGNVKNESEKLTCKRLNNKECKILLKNKIKRIKLEFLKICIGVLGKIS